MAKIRTVYAAVTNSTRSLPFDSDHSSAIKRVSETGSVFGCVEIRMSIQLRIQYHQSTGTRTQAILNARQINSGIGWRLSTRY